MVPLRAPLHSLLTSHFLYNLSHIQGNAKKEEDVTVPLRALLCAETYKTAVLKLVRIQPVSSLHIEEMFQSYWIETKTFLITHEKKLLKKRIKYHGSTKSVSEKVGFGSNSFIKCIK